MKKQIPILRYMTSNLLRQLQNDKDMFEKKISKCIEKAYSEGQVQLSLDPKFVSSYIHEVYLKPILANGIFNGPIMLGTINFGDTPYLNGFKFDSESNLYCRFEHLQHIYNSIKSNIDPIEKEATVTIRNFGNYFGKFQPLNSKNRIPHIEIYHTHHSHKLALETLFAQH